MAEPTVLSAERHFASLREAVWLRFCARHRGTDRSQFEDLYSEWWARELERAAKGAPSQAESPAAFIAEAVHRVLLDDVRARARGLGRDAKGSLELVEFDRQHTAASADDTPGAAAYESLVHRVLTLIQDRLTERETRVFVWSFLYLQASEVTAEALGLTLPRVKKDRRKIAAKVGSEVWSAIAGELDLCAVYDEKSLPAVFEILTVHVEDCPICSAALGGFRSSALAIIGPELLLAGGGAERLTHVGADLVARLNGWLHRGTEALTAVPPNGRTAAAVAVAATAVAGGAATVVPKVRHHERARPEHAQREPRRAVARVTAVPTPVARRAVATPAPHVKPKVATQRSAKRPTPRPHPAATAVATREPITFEAQPAPAAPSRSASSARSTGKPTTEFGFEQP